MAAPAYLSAPPAVSDDMGLVLDFCEAFGLPTPDAAQQLILSTVTGRTEAGRWAAREAAVVVPRQNGKTFGLELAALAHVFVLGTPLVVWSAHKFKTTRETFRRLRAYVYGTDPMAQSDPAVKARRRWLESEVLRMPEANGEEFIELRNGCRIVFLARSAGSGRGFSGDWLVLDEAYALTEDVMADIVPTMAARPDGQTMYASSHPHETSAVLRSVRNRGRRGDPSLAYLEWRAPEGGCAQDRCRHGFDAEGCALDDVALWAAANPAFGSRITEDAIRSERSSMSAGKFSRERLGWDDDPFGVEAVVPLEAWQSCRDERSTPADPVVFAVDVTPDRAWACIAVAGPCPAGTHVEIVEHASGTDWVARRVAELSDRWRPAAVVLDPGGPAGSLLPALQSARVEPTLARAADLAAGCGSLFDLVVQGRLRHRGQVPLDLAVGGATKRPLRDAWAWNRRSLDVDICPLVAVTLAAWGLEQQGAAVAEPSVFLI